MKNTNRPAHLLLLVALCAASATPRFAAFAAPTVTSAQQALDGEWSGTLDWINVKVRLKLQGNQVGGTFFLSDAPFAIEGGTWDAKSGRLSFRWTNNGRTVTVQGTVKSDAFKGTASIGGQADPLVLKRTSKSAGDASATSAVTPYVMQGVVRDERGRPVPNVEVFADNTLYYNANAIGRTDAQGRYRIELPRQELGTWTPGAYVKREYHGVLHEMRLYADDERPFSAQTGAVRNFVWRLSGKVADGYIGRLVYVYPGEGVRISDVEVTLTPSGPLIDGSAGKPITRRLTSIRVEDVPVGRYTMTARLVRNGSVVPLLVSPGQGGNFGVSATNDFEKSNYGITMEFTVKLGAASAPNGAGNANASRPSVPSGGARSISGTVRADVNLEGTLMILCEEKNGKCDSATERLMTIETSGNSAKYAFTDLEPGKSYFVYGWKDVNGDEQANAGDLIGMFGGRYGEESGDPVSVPHAAANFELSTIR